jgi:hypothetical protein
MPEIEDGTLVGDIATNTTAILADTTKIDDAATDGLVGTSNSLAYRVHEIERHFHSYEVWFERAAVPVGETHVADRQGDGIGDFVADAGNNDWGEWIQILGSEDTPVRSGSVRFDLSLFEVSSTERSGTYFFQVAFGASGAAALAAGTYTETRFTPASNLLDTGAFAIRSRTIPTGTKVWVRVKVRGQDTGTCDFGFGLHEYEG